MKTAGTTVAVTAVLSVLIGGVAAAGPQRSGAERVAPLAPVAPQPAALRTLVSGESPSLRGRVLPAHMVSAAAVPRALPDSPVADAAMRSDAETVRSLVKQGADVNAAQGDGMTALHWAARNGDAALVEMLVYAGASPRASTRNGAFTPLHLASKVGNESVIRALLQAGGNPNAPTTTGGATPLHFAVTSGSADAIVALLDGGAAIDAREGAWEQTPLMWAAAYDHAAVVRVLLQRGAEVAAVSKVEDIAAREKTDAADEKRRNQRVAAVLGLARPLDEAEQAAERNAERAETGDVERPKNENERKPMSYGDLVGKKGGLTPLLFAVRQGNAETALALLEGGADVNQVSTGDHTSPILISTLNGQFDLAVQLLQKGADPNLASDAGTTPLYAAINAQWAPKAAYPQPTAYQQQKANYLDLMEALLEAGADPNVRLTKHLWYMEYNFPRLNVDTWGATPFWRAAYGTDVEAMKLLIKHGADPNLTTFKPPVTRRPGDNTPAPKADPSGLPLIPLGGPGVHALHAATGAGYGEGFGANAHRHAPDGWLPSVKYLVEELGVDVNVRDHNGYGAIHHAASRGDNDVIRYLVEKGGDVTAVSRKGQTTADMANGAVQRTQPYPVTVKLLESLGSRNNNKCMSC